MIALDTNIMVHYLVSSSVFHKKTVSNLKSMNDLMCTTQTNIGEVLRLLTHPKVFQKPLNISNAVQLLSHFFETYNIRILEEPSDWWKELTNLSRKVSSLKGNKVFDARIAICLKHSGVKRIFTQDAGFSKYPFLQVILLS